MGYIVCACVRGFVQVYVRVSVRVRMLIRACVGLNIIQQLSYIAKTGFRIYLLYIYLLRHEAQAVILSFRCHIQIGVIQVLRNAFFR